MGESSRKGFGVAEVACVLDDSAGGGGTCREASKRVEMMQHDHVTDKVHTIIPCAIGLAESHEVKD